MLWRRKTRLREVDEFAQGETFSKVGVRLLRDGGEAEETSERNCSEEGWGPRGSYLGATRICRKT